jgi:hypothetical protein
MKKAAVPSILVAAVLLALGVIAEAQQPASIPRVGILAGASASNVSPRVEAFRQRLRELGYVEGKNIVISIDMQKGNANGCLTWQPNWFVSKLTSSSPSPPRLF